MFSSENKVGIFSYNVFWSWFKPDQIAFERHEANILRVHHMHFTDVSIDNAMYQRDSWTTYVLNRTLFYQRTVLTQQQMWLMEWFSPCSVKSGQHSTKSFALYLKNTNLLSCRWFLAMLTALHTHTQKYMLCMYNMYFF